MARSNKTIIDGVIQATLAFAFATALAFAQAPTVQSKGDKNVNTGTNNGVIIQVNPADADTKTKSKLRKSASEYSSLRDRTMKLAQDIILFANQREGNELDQFNRSVASATNAAMTGAADAHAETVRQWRQQTRELFQADYKPRLVKLLDDLENAGIDTSLLTRALASPSVGPRAIGIRLSILAEHVGRKPPFERTVTELEIQSLRRQVHGPGVSVYAVKSDANSWKVGNQLARGLGGPVKDLKTDGKMQSGIRVVYTDVGLYAIDTLANLFLASGQLATLDISKSAPASMEVHIEVWPCDTGCNQDPLIGHEGPPFP